MSNLSNGRTLTDPLFMFSVAAGWTSVLCCDKLEYIFQSGEVRPPGCWATL